LYWTAWACTGVPNKVATECVSVTFFMALICGAHQIGSSHLAVRQAVWKHQEVFLFFTDTQLSGRKRRDTEDTWWKRSYADLRICCRVKNETWILLPEFAKGCFHTCFCCCETQLPFTYHSSFSFLYVCWFFVHQNEAFFRNSRKHGVNILCANGNCVVELNQIKWLDYFSYPLHKQPDQLSDFHVFASLPQSTAKQRWSYIVCGSVEEQGRPSIRGSLSLLLHVDVYLGKTLDLKLVLRRMIGCEWLVRVLMGRWPLAWQPLPSVYTCVVISPFTIYNSLYRAPTWWKHIVTKYVFCLTTKGRKQSVHCYQRQKYMRAKGKTVPKKYNVPLISLGEGRKITPRISSNNLMNLSKTS